jgi:hypothetical protein
MEEWRDIPGYEGWYQVSNLGAVARTGWAEPRIENDEEEKRALDAYMASAPRTFRKRMKPATGHAGRLNVVLTKYRETRKFQIHRLVLLAFVGPCPEGMECRHLDGDHLNNRIENLTWGTHAENMNDKREHGTHIEGENAPQAKLTEADVRAIRAAGGILTNTELAKKYGVTWTAIHYILTRKTWKHVV